MIRVGSRAGNAARRLGQLHRITHSVSLPHFSSVHPPPPPPLPPFNPVSYTFCYYDPCLRLNCTHIFSSALPCSLSVRTLRPPPNIDFVQGLFRLLSTLDILYANYIPKDILVFLQEHPTDHRQPSKGSVFLTTLLLCSYLMSHRQGHRGALGSPRCQGKVRSDRTSQD